MIGYKFKGRVSVKELSEDDSKILTTYFVQKNCKIVETNVTRIRFEIPLFSVGRWHTMTGVTSGSASIISKGTDNYFLYEISIIRFLIAGCVIMAIASIFLMATGKPKDILFFGALVLISNLILFIKQQSVFFRLRDLLFS